jgi:hypothetical protein
MKTKMIALLAGCFVMGAIIGQGAEAPDKPGLYLIGDAGANFIQKTTFKSILGSPASMSLDIDPGARGTIGVGYAFLPTLAAEAELGASYNESKPFIVGGIPGNGSLRLWTVPLTFGVTWRPMIPPEKPSEIEAGPRLQQLFQRSRPYIGAGVGAAEVFADVDTSASPLGSQGSGQDTVLAYYLKAGVRLPITDRIELGLQYRFAGNTGFTIKQTKSEEMFAHAVSVAVRFQF